MKLQKLYNKIIICIYSIIYFVLLQNAGNLHFVIILKTYFNYYYQFTFLLKKINFIYMFKRI